jgi:hypothetical protein
MAFKGPQDKNDPTDFDAVESEVQIAQRLWDDRSLRDLGSFEEALAQAGPNVLDSGDEIGSGFHVLEDKDLLLKQLFFILEWRFNPGKYTNEMGEVTDFVSATVITKANDRWILNDGSTGIAAQLRELSDRTGAFGGLLCRNGLRVSRDYDVTLKDGSKTKGTTYYLA